MEKSITLTSKQLKDLNATDQIVTADALTIYLEENTTSIISEINNAESTLTAKINDAQTVITNQISSTENTLIDKIDNISNDITNLDFSPITNEIANTERTLIDKINNSQGDIIDKIEENKFNDTELMSKLDEILNKIGNAETLLNML